MTKFKLETIADCETELLKIKATSSCAHVRNEVNQLLCITFSYNSAPALPVDPAELEMVRSRTLALMQGEKHPRRVDADDEILF